MMREKIFRLHRHRSSSSSTSVATDASGHKFDFAFSNIQAIQVPKGWDKVTLSLVSPEAGKTARKTGKMPVKNGTCQWTETFAESVWISSGADGSKEMEEYLFKFVLAAGSSKSSTLGEATVNLAAFLSSASPMVVSLPLRKCNYGTILQIQVKCLTPKTNIRDEKWREMQANLENEDHECTEYQSELSDSTSASNNIGSSSRPRELSSRETSFSASVSRYSFDSADDSVGRQSFSSQSERNGGSSVILRQDSIESNESASYCSYSTQGSVRSVRSQGKTEREELRKLQNATASSLQRNGGSSKVFKEVDDALVQELEAGAKMWEQNSRKLTVEVERLRKELSDQNTNTTKLNIELERSRSECCEFTQEIERLKLLLEESSMKQGVDQNLVEDEMRFQKAECENLSLQLKKTQESNIELISILQEMEETVDKQKLEIESLSKADNHEQVLRESLRVVELELQYTQELQRALQGDISVLESTLEDKITETEMEQSLKNQIVKEFVVECNHRLASKEEKIMNLEAALSDLITSVDESKEIRELKEKVQEIERDCSRLTDENLDLLCELKELQRSKEIDDLGYPKIHVSDETIDELGLMDPEDNQNELEKHLSDLQEENMYLSQRVSGLEAQLRYLTDKNEASCSELHHSEAQVKILESQITRLEEEMECQKVNMKQKLLNMQKQWEEAKEECTALSTLNVRLQATTESLIDEYNCLQNFNGDLRAQKMKLQEHCLVLESEARRQRDEVRDNLDSSDRDNKVSLATDHQENLLIMSILDELESKIKLSELEMIQLEEQNSILHMRLQKLPEMKDEVLGLKVSLTEMMTRNQILEASFKSLSKDYDELASGTVSMVEKVCSMQKVVSEAEDCKRKKNVLEEKVLRLEGDLIARDALCLQDVEIKNELSQMKVANSKLLMKVKCLEEVREDLERRVVSLEQKLKQTRHSEDLERRTVSLSKFFPNNQLQDQKRDSHSRRSKVPVAECESRTQLLENELANALKANEVYKLQLEMYIVSMDSAKREDKISMLEDEVEEIRERYLEKSLKYAEVEAQREELLMRLKAHH